MIKVYLFFLLSVMNCHLVYVISVCVTDLLVFGR